MGRLLRSLALGLATLAAYIKIGIAHAPPGSTHRRDLERQADALAALKENEDLLETLNTLFLIDENERLVASVPLARLFLHEGAARLVDLAAETLIQVPVNERQDRVTELFDKYNLLALPVTDEDDKLAGVITADDIISVLRQR